MDLCENILRFDNYNNVMINTVLKDIEGYFYFIIYT